MLDTPQLAQVAERRAHRLLPRTLDREEEYVLSLHSRGYLRGGALRGNPASVEDEHPVTDGLHLLQNVGGEDHRFRRSELAHEPANLEDLVRIQSAGRLVEDENIGVVDDGLREAGALPIAFGEVIDRPIGHLLEAALLNRPVDVLGTLAGGDTAGLRDELQVLHHVELGVERRALGEVPDIALHGYGVGVDIVPVDGGRARSREVVAGQYPKNGGLSRAVRPEEPEYLPLIHLEAHAPYRLYVSVALCDVGDPYHRLLFVTLRTVSR